MSVHGCWNLPSLDVSKGRSLLISLLYPVPLFRPPLGAGVLWPMVALGGCDARFFCGAILLQQNIVNSSIRDRFNREGHMVVPAMVTAKLCYHTSQGKGRATKPVTIAAGPPVPAARVPAMSVHDTSTV